MDKPKTLDAIGIIQLNTLIACKGPEKAEEAYREKCGEVFMPPEGWAIRYLRLYDKYRKKRLGPTDGYIDTKAAARALKEA